MKVLVKPHDRLIEAESGTTVMDALIKAGIEIDAPCGGRGVCGKCRVKISGEFGETTALACKTTIDSDITVELTESAGGHRILTGGITYDVDFSPAVRSVRINVPKPTTADLRSCWERLKTAAAEAAGINASEIRPNTKVAANLYRVLEDNSYDVDAIICFNEIIAVTKPDSHAYAMAYDIGTTTVAAYMIDLSSGKQLAQASTLNPQVKYGADVIMRSKYAIENGTDALTSDVRHALAALCGECVDSVGGSCSDVYLAAVVGNTCMHHLFMGVSPSSLAYAPYTAALTEPVITDAFEYIPSLNQCAKLLMFPNIAGFVGADTVGAALSAQMDIADELTLLIDIGTNGEMVLGDKNRLITCSTAAGPAFEGAVITCGMRGARGAIDHVSLSDGRLSYSVIGGGKPIGICGSGLIDLISELVRTGIVDSGGKLQMGEEIDNPEGVPFRDRVETDGNIRSFVLEYEENTDNVSKLVLTQKDVREIQLAKGAMAAGIGMLAKKLGSDIHDIKKVLIAGAFGSYMSPKSACGIGLIPSFLEERVTAIGNAAGQGALLAALSYPEFERASRLAAQIDYLELAADSEFQDEFVDNLEFPEA